MQSTEHQFANLLSPIVVGGLHLKNRAVMSPMTTGLADDEGRVTSRLREFYRARAAGGVAAVIVEGACIHPTGKCWSNQLCLFEDYHLEGLSRLARDIKHEGALPVLQIMHGGRQTSSSVSGIQPVAPSPIACPRNGEMPRELTSLEIRGLVEDFAETIRVARDVGFDAVELHAAHGYLINEFLSPYSNKRTDEYGGSQEGRTRFLSEIVARTRELVGRNFPLLCRISADEFVPGGIDLQQAKATAQIIARLGISAIDVSAGVHESYYRTSPPAGSGEAVFAHLAHGIKSAVGVPVVAVGRILTAEKAEEILSQRKADLVAFGRALIADPEFLLKAQRSEAAPVVPCIGCNVCNHRSRHREIHCLTNPLAGAEATPCRKVRRKRSILVAGAALSGLHAAQLACQRGYSVAVADPRHWHGGLFHLRREVPNLQELGKAADYLALALETHAVEIRLGVAENDLLKMASEADLVLAALPGVPKTLSIEVTPPPSIIQAQEVLSSPPGPAGRTVVVGGNLLGAETALFLAHAGHDVSLVEHGATLLEGVQPTVAHYLLRWLEDRGVRFHLATDLLSGAEGRVEIACNDHRDSIEADTLVLSLGFEQDSALLSSLRASAKEFHLLGDAYEAGDCLGTVLRAMEIVSAL
jgi:2,4-dienoyl-CoA reductase-like NADH-dependent reductase (Old Yellow Enzyme family)